MNIHDEDRSGSLSNVSLRSDGLLTVAMPMFEHLHVPGP